MFKRNYLSKKMVPVNEKNLRIRINLCLWKRITRHQTVSNIIAVTSQISNAQGIWGTLSKIISGSGGYFSISGTRSWTMTYIKDFCKLMISSIGNNIMGENKTIRNCWVSEVHPIGKYCHRCQNQWYFIYFSLLHSFENR